jgi:hypothetical protein
VGLDNELGDFKPGSLAMKEPNTNNTKQTYSMIAEQKPLPNWILIVSGFFAFMELMVSFLIFFSPQSVLELVDLSAKGVDYLFQVWATRQFALGFIFAFATFKKLAPMLTFAYIFFLVMFVGDFLIAILQQENSLMMSAIIMCIVSSVMLYFINKPSK